MKILCRLSNYAKYLLYCLNHILEICNKIENKKSD